MTSTAERTRDDADGHRAATALPGHGVRHLRVAVVGTDDSYPGCACDVRSLLYSFRLRDSTTGRFDPRVRAGGHFYLRDAYPPVVEALRADLDMASPAVPVPT